MGGLKTKARYCTQAMAMVLIIMAPSLHTAYGQQYLQIIADGPLPKGFRWQVLHVDSAAVAAELSRLTEGLQTASYLEAAVDSVHRGDSLWKAWLHTGPAYRWTALAPGAAPPAALRQAGYRETKWPGRTVERADLDRLFQRLLDYAVNNGYPFAQTGLAGSVFAEGRLSAGLAWDPGPFVTLDSFVLSGEIALKPRFLQQYLGLRPGAPYRQDAVERLAARLRALPFVQLRQEPQVRFIGDEAVLLLDLASRNVSRFDFLVGVLPNNVQFNRLLLTGTLEADLWNPLGAGERIYTRFEQLRPQTQRLDILLNYPYPFGLPLGIDVRAHFYKRDTSFLDAEADLGLQVLLEGTDYIKAFWVQRSSRLLGFNADLLVQRRQLPANLDLSTRFFGLEFFRQRLDDRFSPREGWLLRAGISVGTKQVIPNGRIQELGLGSLYDSLVLRSGQYRPELRVEIFRPLFRRSAFRYAFQGRWLLSQQPVLRNEQYRVGGNRLLRGFDEEFFQLTHYAVNTFEYRFLLGGNSFLFGFLDAAWAEDSTPERVEVFYPYGIGAGITFEVQAGIFGLSLAYGTRWGDPLALSRPKVHLGYIGLF
jgi:outer membrane protein assembly factor BamA